MQGLKSPLPDGILFLSEGGGNIVYSERREWAGGLRRVVKVWNFQLLNELSKGQEKKTKLKTTTPMGDHEFEVAPTKRQAQTRTTVEWEVSAR